MEEIGKTLQETRERLGLTLEEIERITRIRAARLAALERGEFDSMPSEAQVRGFLHNYAEALGLDARELLERYDEARDRAPGPRLQPQPDRPAPGRRHGRTPSELVLTTLVALAVMALLVWGVGQLLDALGGQAPDATDEPAPAAAAVSPATVTVAPVVAGSDTGTSPVVPTAITPTATLILNVLDRVNLRIVAESDSFLEVVVDGEQAFRGRIDAGQELNYTATTAVEITTGNAGGLRVFFNGRDEGLMGEIGQVMVRIWTPRGVQTPTATITLTPTPSPFLSATPTASETPAATAGP